jgi:hypothetical protein
LTLCVAWVAAIIAPTVTREVPRRRVTGKEDMTMSLEHPTHGSTSDYAATYSCALPRLDEAGARWARKSTQRSEEDLSPAHIWLMRSRTPERSTDSRPVRDEPSQERAHPLHFINPEQST